MRIDIVTLFPELYGGVLGHSIVGRAVQQGALTLGTHQLRDHAADKHRTVDGPAFGGGPGMVLKAEPLFAAVEAVRRQRGAEGARVVLTSPQGDLLTQAVAERLARESALILVSGYYEGVDQRFVEHGADEALSIGEYVLTSGDLPAMVLVNSVARLLPEVLGNPESAAQDTFAPGAPARIKAPVYTRPEEFRGWSVPPVLLSGNHKEIEEWRHAQAAARSAEWLSRHARG